MYNVVVPGILGLGDCGACSQYVSYTCYYLVLPAPASACTCYCLRLLFPAPLTAASLLLLLPSLCNAPAML